MTSELLNEVEEEKSLGPCHVDAKTFSLCPVENQRYRKWLADHRCESQPKELGFGTMAAHWVCFQYGMIGTSSWVQCGCGEKFELTHWEHD